jgi:hypothetical protein
MFAIGLNLLGVFEIGGRLAGSTGALDRQGGASGAFLSGVLATIVATPCTAPFMGAALGWALAQPAAAALAVFTALGVGMATPYVTLSLFPAWMARLPRPGPWMETLKQVLSFGLFATAVWLVWVFGLQTGMDGVALLLGALTLVAFAAWIVGRWQWTTTPPRLRLMTRGIALGAVLLAVVAVTAGSRQAAPMAAAAGDAWEPFRRPPWRSTSPAGARCSWTSRPRGASPARSTSASPSPSPRSSGPSRSAASPASAPTGPTGTPRSRPRWNPSAEAASRSTSSTPAPGRSPSSSPRS